MKLPQPCSSRRQFLRRAAVAGGLAFPAVRCALAAGSANDDIRVAIIGLGNKGKNHVKNLVKLPGARLAALCDVDPKRLDAQVAVAKAAGLTVFAATDPRRVLDRRDIDAVIIATPNHWHALLAVWACRAGKDVYVEKPVSHSLWEGAQIVAAAREHRRIVQGGTQYRSDEGLQAARAWLREGQIGRPQSAHVVWFEQRDRIGRSAPYKPDGLDYDLYCGPAPAEPLTRPKLHYDWHWVWSTGDGDLGNSGIHAFDACRWLAGAAGLPRRVMCLGGRFAFDDAGQTPNTQLTVLEFPGLPMLIENRNLPQKDGVKAMDSFRGIREGFALVCEGGAFVGLRGGGSIYDRDGKRVRQFEGDGGAQHQANFIKAIRSRRTEDLNAPIVEGHLSTAVCHLGNISWRLGRLAPVVACRAAVGPLPEAAQTLELLERNVAANGVNLAKTPFTLGPRLNIDGATESIRAVSDGDAAALAAARRLARGSDRPPFSFSS